MDVQVENKTAILEILPVSICALHVLSDFFFIYSCLVNFFPLFVARAVMCQYTSLVVSVVSV